MLNFFSIINMCIKYSERKQNILAGYKYSSQLLSVTSHHWYEHMHEKEKEKEEVTGSSQFKLKVEVHIYFLYHAHAHAHTCNRLIWLLSANYFQKGRNSLQYTKFNTNRQQRSDLCESAAWCPNMPAVTHFPRVGPYTHKFGWRAVCLSVYITHLIQSTAEATSNRWFRFWQFLWFKNNVFFNEYLNPTFTFSHFTKILYLWYDNFYKDT